MSEPYVCSRCGKEAMIDSRMGATNYYLICGCEKNGVWINDRMGGYFSAAGYPIPASEFGKNLWYKEKN